MSANLKNKPYLLVGVVMKKNMIVNTAVQDGSCVILISKKIQKYWMFAVFTLSTKGIRQTNKT